MTPNELFDKNQAFVTYIFKKYFSAYCGNDMMEDILQEGKCGLWKACMSFDEKQGKFTTFAFMYVRGYMQRYILEHGNSIRIPRDIYYSTDGESNEIRNMLKGVVSLESIVYDSDDKELKDFIPGEYDTYDIDVENLIDSFIKTIHNKTHASVMEEYYYSVAAGCKETQVELAEKFGISQSYVVQIKQRYNKQFAEFLKK